MAMKTEKQNIVNQSVELDELEKEWKAMTVFFEAPGLAEIGRALAFENLHTRFPSLFHSIGFAWSAHLWGSGLACAHSMFSGQENNAEFSLESGKRFLNRTCAPKYQYEGIEPLILLSSTRSLAPLFSWENVGEQKRSGPRRKTEPATQDLCPETSYLQM